MKLKIQTWGLLFMLIMASCSSSDDSPAPSTQANISGSVNLYDESTTLVDKSNMTVRVLGTTPVITALTDADGKFVLTNVPFGTYTLEYEKTGYGTYQKTGLIHGNN